MASQKVVNNPLGSYPVAVDRAADGSQRQAVGLDIGDASSGTWVPSRVSTLNPLPVTATISAPATVNQGSYAVTGAGWAVQFRGPLGLPTVNFNIAGIYEVPAVVIGDPFTGSPWNFISGRGLVQMRSTLSAHASVAASASNVTLLADQPLRAGGSIFNDSTANMYLKLGATASTTSFTTIVRPNQLYEIPFGYQGIIDAVWSSATGNARIMECY